MGAVAGGGVVQLPGEARTIDVGGFTVVVHAGGRETSGAFSLIETVEAMTGSGPPLHVHRDAAESFYVIEGEYLMHLDGRDFQCPAGSFVYVPRGMPHTFRASAIGSRKLNLYTPSAMEGYFDDLAEGLRGGVDEAGPHESGPRYAMGSPRPP